MGREGCTPAAVAVKAAAAVVAMAVAVLIQQMAAAMTSYADSDDYRYYDDGH